MEQITMDQAPILQDIRALFGEVSEDEAALVITLTPTDLSGTRLTEHLLELVGLLETIRSDEAIADYVYAIAPTWDGSIESLLVGAKVTTMFANHQLEQQLHGVAA